MAEQLTFNQLAAVGRELLTNFDFLAVFILFYNLPWCTTMSTYENYTAASSDYDRTRVPIGVEIILGCLATVGSLDSLRLLDAGCGTGSYSVAVRPYVGAIDAVDLNSGMLKTARAKIENGTGCPVALHESSVLDLPFDDATFDAVMVNQVLHHLPSASGAARSGIRIALNEFKRVLRPDGVAIINISSHEQLCRAFWYAVLLPDALETVCKFTPDTDEINELLREADFALRDRFVPGEGISQGEAYFGGRGPLDPVWRHGDSIWSVASKQELNKALDKIRKLDAGDELDGFVAEHDRIRTSIGQVGFHFAIRKIAEI